MSTEYDPTFGDSSCETFNRVTSLYFINIKPEHSATYVCVAKDTVSGQEKFSKKVTFFGLEAEFQSEITYSINARSYVGRVTVTGPPMPEFSLRCEKAIAWKTYEAKTIDPATFLYESEFMVYGAELGGNCSLGVFNGFGVRKTQLSSFTESLSEISANFDRATLTLECSLYAFPIIITNLVPSCTEMTLTKDNTLPDVRANSGVLGAVFRKSEGIPNSFSSCACSYTSLNGSVVMTSTIEVLPSSFDRTVVRLRPALKVKKMCFPHFYRARANLPLPLFSMLRVAI